MKSNKLVILISALALAITLSGCSDDMNTSKDTPKQQTDSNAKIEESKSTQTVQVRSTKEERLADVAYYDKTFKYVSNILATSDIDDITSLNKALELLSAKTNEIGDYKDATYDSGYRCSIVKATISGKEQDIPSEPHGNLQAYTTNTYFYLKCYQCKLVGTDLPGDPQVFMNNLNKDANMFRSELSRLSGTLK